MVGIIGAMKSEMDEIKARVENPSTETISGMDFIEGTINGTPVVVATSGMGKVSAAICAQAMILKYSPDLMINVGVAGSLTPKLNIGDIAVADAVVQHDMDTTGLGDPLGFISGIDVIDISCDDATVKALAGEADKLGYKNVIGMIVSGDAFIDDSDRKKHITDNFPAIACEMEGAGMGQACYVNKIPFCVLRAISDNGDESGSEDYGISLEMAVDRATRVIIEFLAAAGK